MKFKIVESEPEKFEKYRYPMLVQSSNFPEQVVLLVGKGKGLIVRNIGGNIVGTFAECWDERLFVPFTGSVTLSNEEY